jgi:hypothetical protein
MNRFAAFENRNGSDEWRVLRDEMQCAEQSSAVVASPWIRGQRFAELRSAQSGQRVGQSEK